MFNQTNLEVALENLGVEVETTLTKKGKEMRKILLPLGLLKINSNGTAVVESTTTAVKKGFGVRYKDATEVLKIANYILDVISNNEGEDLQEIIYSKEYMLAIASKKFIASIEAIDPIPGYIWERSPQGESYYYFPKGDKISWGYKPEESFRVSDHWHFENKKGDIECPLEGANAVVEKTMAAKFKNGVYSPL